MREWEAVADYRQLLQDLTGFKNEHGTLYVQMRDFFSRMVNAEDVPGAVPTSITDWRTLRQEHTITTASRWSDLLTAYHAAGQAPTDQIESQLRETREGLAQLTADLSGQLATAGVPAERIDEELTELATGMQRLQAELEQSTISYGESRRLRNDLAKLRMNLPARVREAGRRYLPLVPEQPIQNLEVHMNWHILG